MGFGLLIMNDDTTCANIVSKLLNACNHRELHKGKLFDCMVALWNTKDTLEPILFTNVNRLGIKGTQLVKGVGMLLNFNIIQMNPEDDVGIRFITGRPINASAYVINISSLDTMNSLWKLANESSPPDPASSHRRYIEPQLHLSTKKANLYTKAITVAASGTKSVPSFITSTLGLGCGTKIQAQMNSTNLPVCSNPLTLAEPPEKLPQKSSHQNEDSIYSPSTGYGTSGQESSLPQGEDINSFLNGMGSLGSGSFWQRVYDYAHRPRLL